MKAALIVMTIMGCDDSATQCHYIDTVDRQWQTVALCDAQAEAHMSRHQDANYPVIVAFCESVDAPATADAGSSPGPGPEATPAGDALQALAFRVLAYMDAPAASVVALTRTLADAATEQNTTEEALCKQMEGLLQQLASQVPA